MPGATLRSLHDNVALVEMDGCVAAAGAHRQFSSLIHFHFRAIKQPHLGMGIGRRANEFTLADFVTQFQSARGFQEGLRSTSCAPPKPTQPAGPPLPLRRTVWQSSTGNRVPLVPSAS